MDAPKVGPKVERVQGGWERFNPPGPRSDPILYAFRDGTVSSIEQ